MDYLKWMNLASNIVLSGSFGAFMIFLFGRENSIVYTLKSHSTLALKMGLSMCAAGSLYTALTLPDSPPSEVLLNVGLATLMSWAAWFHYKKFVKECPSLKKVVISKKMSKKARFK